MSSSPAQSQPLQKGQQTLTILIYSFELHPGTRLKGAAPPVGGRVATGRQFGHWDGKLWILQKMGDLAGKRKIIISMHKARGKKK